MSSTFLSGLLVYLIFCLLNPPQVFAANYYLSPTGNDNDPGAIETPWKTFQKATLTARAGDTVYARAGTYHEQVYISQNGTASSPITFAAYPGELAVIDGRQTLPGSRYASLVNLAGDYNVFKDFEIKNSNGRGLQITGDYGKAIGNNIHHAFEAGIYVYGSHGLVENNRVWRTVESNYTRDNGNWSCGIAWGATQSPNIATNTVIRRNQVFQNSGEGIGCMYTEQGLVEGNTVYDNWAMNIYLDTCSHITIQKNLIYYTSDKQFWRHSTAPQGGIVMANENIQNYPIGRNRTIINNILVNNGTHIGFWSGWAPGASLLNDFIAHNTLVNAYEVAIGFDAAPHQSVNVVNNLVYQTQGAAAKLRGGGVTLSHNLWYPLPGTSGPGDVNADPLLANPNGPVAAGQVKPEWYLLRDSASPAINQGTPLTQVKSDFFDNSRQSAPDIGAAEHAVATATANPSPTITPSPSLFFKPGDANQDNLVDETDYLSFWKPNYLARVSGIAHGDFNGDNSVDGIDYVIWLNNYTQTY